MSQDKPSKLNALWNQPEESLGKKSDPEKPTGSSHQRQNHTNRRRGNHTAARSNSTEHPHDRRRPNTSQQDGHREHSLPPNRMRGRGRNNQRGGFSGRCQNPSAEGVSGRRAANSHGRPTGRHASDCNSQNPSAEDGNSSNECIGRRAPNPRGKTAREERDYTPITFHQAKNLSTKDANEILLTFVDPMIGLDPFLKLEIVQRDVMAYVLIALAKSLSSYMRNNVSALMQKLVINIDFLHKQVPLYLASLQRLKQTNDYHFDSLKALADLLNHLQTLLPSTASDILFIISPVLEKICQKYLSEGRYQFADVIKQLSEIEENNQHFLKGYTAKENELASKMEQLHLQQPPENYRTIPVLPNEDDIEQPRPFLRPNITRGSYADTEHYLDVQYRLLREDYIRPLRDGVSEYKRLRKSGKSLKGIRDVRVYNDVHIVKQDFVNGGLVHIAEFSDKNFSNIKWEYSKRFLTGSLLCLSSDDFQSMLFAAVAKRDPKELQKGLLLIKFEDLSDEVLNLNHLRNFVVIETNAYFEAYRYNLNALHKLNDELLPMKNYIVDVQKDVDRPHYLNMSSFYDMRPLLLPLSTECIQHIPNKDGKSKTVYSFPSGIEKNATKVEILKDNAWPTATELSLDPSQYAAIKAAVTKEFAIIQGPPGTGKTYVGLRIAQLLLHNIDKWQPTGGHSPILVVCYTNHALDQFLEGLLLFTKNIVRVGGRAQNEAILKYQLVNLKRAIEDRRQVPIHIFKSIKQQNFDVRRMKENIDDVQKLIVKSYSSVLNEIELADNMDPEHLDQLRQPFSTKHNDGRVLFDWLGTRHRDIGELAFNDNVEVPVVKENLHTNIDADRLKEYLRNYLDNIEIMQPHEVQRVHNIWLLSFFHRWRLYKFWLERFIYHQQNEIMTMGVENSKNVINALVEECYTSVLSEDLLRGYMGPLHYATFKSVVGRESIMSDWLGIPLRPTFVLRSLQAMQQPNAVQVENYEENDSDNEADIEYIEGLREINTEEFDDVSYEIPVYRTEMPDNVVQMDNGWQVQGGKKGLHKYIQKSLKHSQSMSEAEVKRVSNVWALTPFDRWRLYKYWLTKFIAERQKEILELQQELRKEFLELCEMRSEEDLYVCQQADVVGMTTTGAAKYRELLQHLNPRIVIVEEAAEILESHIVTSLAPGTQHVILIGDHQQLRPSPTVYALATKFGLDVSLFERMVKNEMQCYKLGLQHRMRPEIAALLVPHIYTDLENHESVTKYENINGISKNVFFISHDHCELQEVDSKSKVNVFEARFLVKLCRYVLLQGYDPSQITVLTTYSGQLFEMKRKVREMKLLQGVKFTVVDNYQGEENDIILVSFVRSNEEGAIGFLKIANRVCVALSRAKKALYCIGNFELLADKSELWKNIVGTLEKNQSIGPSLQLMCQNHPGVSNIVACEKDFDSVPEGGCTRNCEFRLSCGHVCTLMCHPYDADHEEVRCSKPCNKKCEYDHPCKKKCFQHCGDCTELIDRKMESCSHVMKVKCKDRSEPVLCTAKCDKILRCGHACMNMCYLECTIVCREQVSVQSPCGHTVTVSCSDVDNEELLLTRCTTPCLAQLMCGHTCRGKCSDCRQGRFHVSCNQPCKRILVCGHECKSPCSKTCPPCKRKCENRCAHSKCPKKCGEPCDECSEPCEWHCDHVKCDKKCGEVCDRKPCDQPCDKRLPCEHECIGVCGEPCPKKCRVCDKDEVEEIFFGSEDEPGARFICLEDCEHVFEIEGITTWMQLSRNEDRAIQMKACPKCKTVIRRNLRFGGVVKTCLREIEKVKKVTYGSKEKNLAKQRDLLRKIENKLKPLGVLSTYKPLLQLLQSSRSRNIQEVTILDNMINIALLFESSAEVIDNDKALGVFSVEGSTIKDTVTKFSHFMRLTIKWIHSIIVDECLTASEQQLHELTWEVHRIKLADRFWRFIQNRPLMKANAHFDAIVKLLMSPSPIRELKVELFTSEFKNLARSVGEAIINVSDFEKQSILKAMGLSKGHWYHCPNGHVYCITECGGAMQVSKCNECGAEIGGMDHTLIRDNRVATAMDGSQHGAWSEAMNMENFHF